MPDFCTIDNRCLDSWHILISGQFKHRYPLNISCSKIFDSCKIKRMVTNLTQLGYVNNYDKNRYLENFMKQLYTSKRFNRPDNQEIQLHARFPTAQLTSSE